MFKKMEYLHGFGMPLFILLCAFMFANAQQPGDRVWAPMVDTSFNGDLSDGPTTGRAVGVQPDGKIVVGGGPLVNGVLRDGIARFNVDGSLDTGFNTTISADLSVIRFQPDGKILIGGNTTVGRIVRLNSDGSLDQSFVPGSAANDAVYDILLQPDSKIIIVGAFTQYNGMPASHMARLNPNGVLDPAFSPPAIDGNIHKVVLQPDSKVVVVGNFFANVGGVNRRGVARFNTDGTLDASFDPGTIAFSNFNSVALQANGKILVGGAGRIPIVRLESGGAADATFVPVYPTPDDSSVQVITVLPDGKILAGGQYSLGNGAYAGVARFETTGARGLGFALQTLIEDNTSPEVLSMDLAPNGRIVATGNFYKVGSEASINKHIVRLNIDGTIDTGFSGSIEGYGSARTIVEQPDGRIIVGGSFRTVNGSARSNIVRFNSDGSIDPSFNAGTNYLVSSVALQSDGKILVGGEFSFVNGVRRSALVRLNANGSLDESFNPTGIDSGYISTLVVQPDGRILAGGLMFTPLTATFRTGILRVNSDGSPDNTFAVDPASDYVRSILLLSDGRIYVVGSFSNFAGSGRSGVARLNSNGIPDTSFNVVIGPDSEVDTIVQQPDGKLLIGGGFTTVNGATANRIARLNPNGTSDTSFNTGLGFNTTVLDIDVLPDGQGSLSIFVGGFFTGYNGVSRNGFARLSANGSLSDFNENIGGYVSTIAIQSNGRVLIGGIFTTVAGQPHRAIARLSVDPGDPCFAIPLTFGQTFGGSINAGSCVINSLRTGVYSFTGIAGDQIALTLFSPDLAMRIELLAPDGSLVAADSNPSGTDSIRLPGSGYLSLPSSGSYLIRAIPLSSTLSGDFSLSLYRLPSTACNYYLSPSESIVPSTGGSFYFDVISDPDCPPPAQPLTGGTIFSGLSYAGGRVAFTVFPNIGAAREETITIAGRTHRIRQFSAFAPSNDLFANAQVLNGTSSPPNDPVLGSNSNATAESGEPIHAGSPAARSVWYSWSPPTGASGLYTFSTSGSSFNTVMAIYACPAQGPCSFSGLTPIASNDDTTFFDKTSKVNFNAASGTQYRIAIDGKNGEVGTIELSWRPYQRLYRLYLQNYNGFGSPIIPDSIRADNGTNTVFPALVSQGVYEFDLPPDNSVYTVSITGPAGIVWDPNNIALDTSFRHLDELMHGDGASGGQNVVSNAQNQTPRYVYGFIKNVTPQELAGLTVIMGSSRGPNPREERVCSPLGSQTIAGIPYATYQCESQPNTLHDVVPLQAGKGFTISVLSFGVPVSTTYNGTPGSSFIAANAPTYNIAGRVTGGGAGTRVDLTYTPPGNTEAISLRATTASDGSFTFQNLVANTYSLKAIRSGFIFTQPPPIGLQSNQNIEIAAEQVCSYTPADLATIPANGGIGQFTVTTSQPGCEWLAASDVPWITINSGAIVGNGPVHFTAQANAGAGRIGSVRIQGRTDPILVQQAATNPTFGTISGRVLTPSGIALRNAVVTIIDSAGQRQTAATSSFGVYNFTNVQLGQIYTATVTSKRYRFTARTLPFTTNMNGVDFVGLE